MEKTYKTIATYKKNNARIVIEGVYTSKAAFIKDLRGKTDILLMLTKWKRKKYLITLSITQIAARQTGKLTTFRQIRGTSPDGSS